MLRIAVATDNQMVTEHFGHCKEFMLFDTQDEKILEQETIANPGGGAVDIFNSRDVEVIVGAQGDARAAVEAYLKGELKSTGSVCHEHQHHDTCGE